MDYYKEVIPIELTRAECVQLLDMLVELVELGYNQKQIIHIHHKIFDQTFGEVEMVNKERT